MFYGYVEHNFKDQCRFLNYLLLRRRQVQAILCCVLVPPARKVQGYGRGLEQLAAQELAGHPTTADDIAEGIVCIRLC